MKKCSIKNCSKEATEKARTLCKTHFYYLITKPKRDKFYKDFPELVKAKWARYRSDRKKRREIERKSHFKTHGLFIIRKKLLRILKKILKQKIYFNKLNIKIKKRLKKRNHLITSKKKQILRRLSKYAFTLRRRRKIEKRKKLISKIEKSTGHPFKQVYILIRSKINFCRKNNLPYSTLNQFLTWYVGAKKFCFYCGIPESILQSKSLFAPKNSAFLEIDRKDSKLGYTTDNMVLSCSRCNITKSSIFSSQEMLTIAEKYIKPKWQV
jgi:hypothetical protein